MYIGAVDRERGENSMNINDDVTAPMTAVWKVTLMQVISTELSDVGPIGRENGGRGCLAYMGELKVSACSR